MKVAVVECFRATSGRCAVWGVLLGYAGALCAASSTPATVSPSGRTGHACPSFSWSAASGGFGYELLVYSVSAEGVLDTEPALAESLPSGALSWTPPLDRCLVPGELYAWWIGAREDGNQVNWSAPAVVEIGAAPSLSEVEAALATLARYRSALEDSTGSSDSVLTSLRERDSLTLPPSEPPQPTLLDEREAETQQSTLARTVVAAPAPSVTVPFAALKVEGEVRTINTNGEPRLWGRGRQNLGIYQLIGGPCTHGSLRFGLSTIAVDWGSAADACPAGTWVCTNGELSGAGNCNTGRPDNAIDGRACDGLGVDFAPDNHMGWLQSSNPTASGSGAGATRVEKNAVSAREACYTLPVWCCWE